MNKMSEGEIGYLAGLFDGEGWFVTHPTTISMHVAMVDFDVIERIHQITGVGNLNEVPPRGTRKQWQLQWSVGVYEHIVELINVIMPHLSERRTARANEVLSEIQIRQERAEWRTTHFVCGHDKVEDNTYHFPETGPNQGKTACRECQRNRGKNRGK